jgi:hypothetical protein
MKCVKFILFLCSCVKTSKKAPFCLIYVLLKKNRKKKICKKKKKKKIGKKLKKKKLKKKEFESGNSKYQKNFF